MEEARQGQPNISIVVPAYNAASSLDACLHALSRQRLDEPYEIVVVDDGSTDETASIASMHSSWVKLVWQAHSGPAAARNRGVQAARGDIILFTDADCEPTPTWAYTLTQAIRAGAAGAKGTYRTRQKGLIARFVQAEYESKYRGMSKHNRIDFIDTYSAAYRRDAFLDTGGFNETLLVDEDQELSFRLAERGYDLRFIPGAIVYHRHVDSPSAYFGRKFRIGYWKVKVVALHPGRIATDSHTPPSVKAQMLLLGGVLAASPFVPFSRLAMRLLAGSVVGLAASVVPFALTAGKRDVMVGMAAPMLLLLRAAGLLAGIAWGLGSFGLQLAWSGRRIGRRFALR